MRIHLLLNANKVVVKQQYFPFSCIITFLFVLWKQFFFIVLLRTGVSNLFTLFVFSFFYRQTFSL